MSRRALLLIVAPGVVFLGLFWFMRTRLAGLPEVPGDLTAERAGVAALERWAEEGRRLDAPLPAEEAARFDASPPASPVDLARLGRHHIAGGDPQLGLELLAEALARDPSDLVIGNAFRMAVIDLKRSFLAEARERGERLAELPEFLREEPLATLERLAAAAPGREIRLQVALAHVDRMVLNPALEIKAPASIDSVRALSAILEGRDAWYIPALFGRGLNYLYRPRKLVWPEHPAPPEDAASRDLALAAAAGAKVGGAPPRLRGLLLVTLGDALAHEGRVGLARSWWVLARETCDDAAVREHVDLRMEWSDREVPERLEQRLETRMADQEHPVSDLSFLWDDTARMPS